MKTSQYDLRKNKSKDVIFWVDNVETIGEHFRITSYNVCYTKLLRPKAKKPAWPMDIRPKKP